MPVHTHYIHVYIHVYIHNIYIHVVNTLNCSIHVQHCQPELRVGDRGHMTTASPHLMQRVQCIHLVIIVFTRGPMFLSSTALQTNKQTNKQTNTRDNLKIFAHKNTEYLTIITLSCIIKHIEGRLYCKEEMLVKI